MAEQFRDDPALAATTLNVILANDEQGELLPDMLLKRPTCLLGGWGLAPR